MPNMDYVIKTLKSLGDPGAIEGKARCGITPEKTYGVKVPHFRKMAKEIGTDHKLVLKLWEKNIQEMRIKAFKVFALLLVLCLPVDASQGITSSNGDTTLYQQELVSHGIYDFVTAVNRGRSIGEMVLDIEGAPERAYDVLEYAVYLAAYAIRSQDDEITALRKVDSILFEHMGFTRGIPGTTFSDALTKGILDCSDASIIFISAAQRAGRDWRAAMAPFHMFVAAPEGEWFIFWETQTGEPFDVFDMINYHGLRNGLIEAGIYLNRMTPRHHIAEAYRNIGGNLVRNGDYKKGLQYLNKSLWLWPDHPPTLIWRGYAYALAGEYAMAEFDYFAALTIDPYDWVANFHLGVLYTQVGKTEEGKALLELAERYKPLNAAWVLEEALPYLQGDSR